MTREQEIAHLDKQVKRDQRMRKVFVIGALIIALAALIFALTSASANRARLDTLEGEVDRSDSAAQSIAQEKQDQAQSVTALCESGSVKKDDRGKEVCSQAKAAADDDPADKVQSTKGDTGQPGPQGPQGLPGAPGATGPAGKAGKDSTVAGPVGTKGQPGIQGVPGPQGNTGEQGSTGDPGTAGDDGEQGPSGAKGADGSPGNKGDTGAAGTSGSKGDTGPAGPAGKDGASGKDGATGPQGPKGDTGPAGKDGSNGSDGKSGRGITSAKCDPADGRWDITYSDGEVQDGGPCLATPTNPAPSPTPTDTPTEEVTP